MEYLVYQIINVIIAIVCFYGNLKGRLIDFILFIQLALYSIVFGLRNTTFGDTLKYSNMYYGISSRKKEFLYELISSFSSNIGISFEGFILIYSIVSYLCLYFLFKELIPNKKYKCLNLLLLFSTVTFITFSAVIIRQFLATVICFYGIFQKKRSPLIYILIGLGFHVFSIIFLLYIILEKLNFFKILIKKKILYIYFLICFLFFNFSDNVIRMLGVLLPLEVYDKLVYYSSLDINIIVYKIRYFLFFFSTYIFSIILDNEDYIEYSIININLFFLLIVSLLNFSSETSSRLMRSISLIIPYCYILTLTRIKLKTEQKIFILILSGLFWSLSSFYSSVAFHRLYL